MCYPSRDLRPTNSDFIIRLFVPFTKALIAASLVNSFSNFIVVTSLTLKPSSDCSIVLHPFKQNHNLHHHPITVLILLHRHRCHNPVARTYGQPCILLIRQQIIRAIIVPCIPSNDHILLAFTSIEIQEAYFVFPAHPRSLHFAHLSS